LSGVLAGWRPYHWAPHVSVPSDVRLYEATCGRHSCRAVLALALLQGKVQAKANMHSGLIWDALNGCWHLAERAAKQWKRARARGTSWSNFYPKTRNPYKAPWDHAPARPFVDYYARGPGRKAIDARAARSFPDPPTFTVSSTKFPSLVSDLPTAVVCPLCHTANRIEVLVSD
jgi:hypothetical protein